MSHVGVNIKDEFFDFATCAIFKKRDLNDEDVLPLCANLGRFKSLKEINLIQVNNAFSLTEVGGRAVAESLMSNSDVETLLMHSNTIGDNGAIAIGECLKINCSLIAVQLASNKIGNVGAIAIGECLKVNKSVLMLDLASNNIGYSGLIAIAEGLKINRNVQKLNLEFNNRNEDSRCEPVNQEIQALLLRNREGKGITIQTFFYDFQTCQYIYPGGMFNETEVNDKDILPLGKNLGRFKRLKGLKLKGTLTDSSGRAIVEGLQSNSSVTEIELEGSSISNGVKGKIQALLRRNQEGKGIVLKEKFYSFEGNESEIYFTDLRLTDDEFQPLCENLGRFERLRTIYLRGNCLTDVSGRELVLGLQSNSSVIMIDVDYCYGFSDAVKMDIIVHLNRNRVKDYGIFISGFFYDFETCVRIEQNSTASVTVSHNAFSWLVPIVSSRFCR